MFPPGDLNESLMIGPANESDVAYHSGPVGEFLRRQNRSPYQPAARM
jgi:hypothetical protein